MSHEYESVTEEEKSSISLEKKRNSLVQTTIRYFFREKSNLYLLTNRIEIKLGKG